MLKAAVVFCIFILSGSAWPVSTRLGTIDVSNPLAKRLVQFSKPTHSGGGSISLPDRERSLFVARINTVGIREFDVYYVFDAADEAQYLI